MDIADRYRTLDAEVFPWFNSLWQRLVELHEKERLPHALLINGMEGIGKVHLAQAVAGYVMCHHPSAGSACGQCRSCQLLHSSGHPDLFFLQPEDTGKPIKVDQIRQLNDFMHNTAQQGGYRVVVLSPAEAMNASAANALLKMLEEPGRDTLLILITHQLGQVMPTIKSRCQRLDCHPPAEEVAIDWLMQRLGIESAEALQLLRLVHGAPLAGVWFKEQGHQTLRADFMLSLRDILRQKKTPLEVAEAFMKSDIILLLGWLHGVLADITLILATQDSSRVRNRDMEKMLQGVAKHSNAGKLFDLVDRVQSERLSLQRRQNPNKQLLLEGVLIEWFSLIRS